MTTNWAVEPALRFIRGSNDDHAEWLFRALYSLPARRALEVARFALNRYLPIFQSRNPGITWPAELLGDVEAWVAAHETDLLDGPDVRSPDTAFRYALYALLVAWVRRDDATLRTAAAAVAIREARGAFETTVWMADEPAAYTAWATGDLANIRGSSSNNAAVIAVGEREWLAVVGQLACAPSSDAELEAGLKRWRENDHMLMGKIVPGSGS
jgi:hypothetical protein